MMVRGLIAFGVGAAVLLTLSGCSSAPEKIRQVDACALLDDEEIWRDSLIRSVDTWDVPPALLLALMEQPLSVIDKTHVKPHVGAWDEYRAATANWKAKPEQPESAVDFLGWHLNRSASLMQLDWRDTKAFYLSYRLGPGAYRDGIYKGSWTEVEAGQIAIRADRIESQLRQCPELLDAEDSWYRFW